MCGRFIDEPLRVGKSVVSYEDWIRFATFDLEEDAHRWLKFQRMNGILALTLHEASEIRSLLHLRFPSNSSRVTANTLSSHEYRLCRLLVAEGVLQYDDQNEHYMVPFIPFPFCFISFDSSNLGPLSTHAIPYWERNLWIS